MATTPPALPISSTPTPSPASSSSTPDRPSRDYRGSRANPHTPQLPSTSAQPAARSIEIRESNPVPLTAAHEAEVKELYYKRVRGKCAGEIREFATCSTGRTFSISWACRAQRLAMNKCMNSYANLAEEDAAREQWFRTLPERAREKQEEEEWKESQRQKKREWWGLDEQGRRVG